MTLTQLAAKMLTRLGLVMLILAVVCRILIPAEANTIIADLAVIISGVVVFTGTATLIVLRRRRPHAAADDSRAR